MTTYVFEARSAVAGLRTMTVPGAASRQQAEAFIGKLFDHTVWRDATLKLIDIKEDA